MAANRPVFVGPDDATAFADMEPGACESSGVASNRRGEIPAEAREPANLEELCAHPINFIVGGPETVCRSCSVSTSSPPSMWPTWKSGGRGYLMTRFARA